jgi:DnaJ-class molecular chaperone
VTEHSDIMRQLEREDCPECGGTGNFYGNDEDGDYLPCDECDGTGFKKEK